LGLYFETGPVTSMEDLFQKADSVTPIIFVLSQGVDSSFLIIKYAERQDQALTSTSLGQGQNKLATKLIIEGQKEGNWVLLQNCHLYKSWMPSLEGICGQMKENKD
jgi:dynein heavy chain, axonemal